MISEVQSDKERRGEKTSGCSRQLIDLTVPIDLNYGQDLTLSLPPDWRNLTVYSDWLLLTDRCIVIGCLLGISIVHHKIDYPSMIVKFISPATRGFSLTASAQMTGA